VHSVISGIDNNISVVCINSTTNFNNLSFLINNISILYVKELPPSCIGSCNVKLVVTSFIWNVDWFCSVCLWLDGSCQMIKVEDLMSIVFLLILEIQVASWSYSQCSMFWKSRDQIEWSVSVESTIIIKSASWFWCLLIKIKNSPFLSSSTVSSVHHNIVSFLIFSTMNIQYFTVLNVYNVLSIQFELLEPVLLSVSCVQVIASSISMNVQRLSWCLALDGQTLLVEPPNLALVAIWLLDDNLLMWWWIYSLEVSSSWKHWFNMEWPFNVETEVFIEFSLLWFTLPVINIDDVPKLVQLSIALAHDNVFVFIIFILIYFHW